MAVETMYLRHNEIAGECVVSSGSGLRISAHTHVARTTAILVRSGTVTLTFPDRSIRLEGGGCAVVPTRRRHAVSSAGPYSMLTFCLDADGATRQPPRTRIAALLRPFRECISSREKRTLMDALSRYQGRENVLPEDAIASLHDLLVAHPETDISLSEMARRVCLEKSHFVRRFTKRYGLPPGRFHTQNRLRKARSRLLDASATLTETAHLFGFYDQSHFIRCFKSYHAITPSQYVRGIRLI